MNDYPPLAPLSFLPGYEPSGRCPLSIPSTASGSARFDSRDHRVRLRAVLQAIRAAQLREDITLKKRRKRELTLCLPDEFLDLCEEDLIDPEFVLRAFIADLCKIINWQSNPRADGYNSNGADERDLARHYYNRVGYPHWAQAKRQMEME